MLQTIILLIALVCAFIALLHTSNQYITSLVSAKDANTIPTLFLGIISIIFFCIFYYLTH